MGLIEQVVDSFAGGGGAATGIARAIGREVDIAINHDPSAIEMHAANHPNTKHYTEDVWRLSPRKVTKGRPVGLLWASPDCTHFSKAKGGKPVKKNIRSLAWVVIKWAVEAKPRVIMLENVREFEEWGPLVPRWTCDDCDWRGTEGQARLVRRRRACPRCDSRSLTQTQDLVPDPSRKGLTFKRWVGRLRNLGYAVEWKVLNAADYGAPTHRRRLFLIARRDGLPIVWPEPTHGQVTKEQPELFGEPLKPWRTAAECIDWSLPCPSIFERKRPLAEKTLRRIALGIKRYVLDNPRPFLVVCNHGGPEFRGQDLDKPLPTMTAARDAHGLVAPVLARIGQTGGNGKYVNGVDEPIGTVVSKSEHLLISPTLIQTGYGERAGQAPRTLDINKPMGTAVAGGCKQALVAAFLAKHYGGAVGCPINTPLPTTTARGTQNQVAMAFLSKYHGQKTDEHHCTPADEPIRTIDTQGRHALVAANLLHLNNNTKPTGPDVPLHTVTGGGKHAALVYSFLTKYFGTAIGTALDAPAPTATSKHRLGLVTVHIQGEPYVIVDIGMRMLRPRELARGQGFPDSYILTGTATNQVKKIGNSVPPVMAEMLVRANYVASVLQEAG